MILTRKKLKVITKTILIFKLCAYKQLYDEDDEEQIDNLIQ